MVKSEPAAYVFRDDLCDRADWSAFKGYGSIKPIEDDVDFYEEPTGRMECVRYFDRPDRHDVGGDALTVRLKLGDAADHIADVERLRTEKGWTPIERSNWDACVHRASEFDLEYTCAVGNLLATFSSDTVIISPDAGYVEVIFEFMDDVRGIVAA